MIACAEPRPLSTPDVLGQLLHSLCQPLTTLRCSLELALDELPDRPCETVSAALEQADRAIETVRLMREYLETEHGTGPVQSVSLASAVHAVLAQLSHFAHVYGIPLLACGISSAALEVNEFWLQRALRYVMEMLLDDPQDGSVIAVLLEDRPLQTLLSVHRPGCRRTRVHAAPSGTTGAHLRQAKLAIARRVFESAGASVEFCSDFQPGCIVRIPQAKVLVHKLSA